MGMKPQSGGEQDVSVQQRTKSKNVTLNKQQ
jgi:hypothetical protein